MHTLQLDSSPQQPYENNMIFTNRRQAGQLLAAKLRVTGVTGQNTIIYALPRGGVEIGAEIALALGARLDIIIARKIGHPDNPEFAVCAITEAGHLLCDESAASLDKDWLNQAASQQQKEAQRRRQLYKEGRPSLSPTGKTAILTDDGIATGLTMLAALKEVKEHQTARIIVAVPVLPPDFLTKARGLADQIIYLNSPNQYLGSVGAHYEDFPQVSDEEVINILASSF